MSHQDDTIRVYISGGPNRQRFSNGLTQKEIGDRITSRYPNVKVVKSGKTQYIIVDNENEDGPSETALETLGEGGEVICYHDFMSKMERKYGTKKKTSNKKKSMRAAAGTLTLDVPEDEQKKDDEDLNEHMSNLKVDTENSPIIVFAKYVSYLYMFISQAIEADAFLRLMGGVTKGMTYILSGTSGQQPAVQESWASYWTEFVRIHALLSQQNQPCSKAVYAQRALTKKSNLILTALLPMQTEKLQRLLNFFTDHNETLVQFMISADKKKDNLIVLDQLLSSMQQFTTQ